jgi:hypothetical protein
VVTGPPSAAEPGGAAAIGPSDVAEHVLLTVGLGADPAVCAGLPAQFQDVGWLLRADPEDGSTERVADIAGFEGARNPDGGRPDSSPNAVLVSGWSWSTGREPRCCACGRGEGRWREHHRDLPVAATDGVADRPPASSQMPAEAAPTSVTRADRGRRRRADRFPFASGGAQLLRVAGDGSPETVATGLTDIVDVEADDGAF